MKTNETATGSRPAVSRRDALKSIAVNTGVLIILPVLATAAHADTPAAPSTSGNWKAIGSTDDFPPKAPKRIDLGVGVVWVVRADPKTYDCVSATCTHMSCELAWINFSAGLACPCHLAKFMPDGSFVPDSFPRSLPNLKTLPVRITDDTVEVDITGLK